MIGEFSKYKHSRKGLQNADKVICINNKGRNIHKVANFQIGWTMHIRPVHFLKFKVPNSIREFGPKAERIPI